MFHTIRAHRGWLLRTLAHQLNPPPQAILHLFVLEQAIVGTEAALTGTRASDPALLRKWAGVLSRRADMIEADASRWN